MKERETKKENGKRLKEKKERKINEHMWGIYGPRYLRHLYKLSHETSIKQF